MNPACQRKLRTTTEASRRNCLAVLNWGRAIFHITYSHIGGSLRTRSSVSYLYWICLRANHAAELPRSDKFIRLCGCGRRHRELRLCRPRLWCCAGRPDQEGRGHRKGRNRHRGAEGLVPPAADDPLSQGQSLHPGEGRARQEALFRHAAIPALRAILRELPQPELRLGRRVSWRRGPPPAED